MVQPKLADGKPGEGAFWKDFDMDRAAREGMAIVGLPYSGKLGWAETEMTWPVNHMVGPKQQAVGCTECHAREGSRLAGLRDFYMPGRDANRWVDGLGRLSILLSLAGVFVHAGVRVAASRRRPEAGPGGERRDER